MKVYVINLKRAHNRRSYMKNQLDRLPIDYEFITALDSRELSDADFVKLGSRSIVDAAPHRRGLIAAAHSHLSALEKMLVDKNERALILEDDVILPDNLLSVLETLLPDVLRDTVVLLRYYSHSSHPLKLSSMERQATLQGYELLAPVDLTAVASGAAYVVSAEVAARMLAHMRPVNHVPDDWTVGYRVKAFSRLLCLHPQVIADAPFVPTIDYPATRTVFARLKANVRQFGAVNRLIGLMRPAASDPRECILICNDAPFWVTPPSSFEERM